MTEYSYDNDGSSSFIFLLAALVLYLAPTTYWRLVALFEKPKEEALRHQNTQFLSLCRKKKARRLVKQKDVWTRSNIIYACAWLAFLLVLLGVYTIRMQEVEVYNPYEIMGLSQGASEKEIKVAYRKLSRTAHPDKRPDDPLANEKYMEIVKAYQALTDPAVRENWEKYGHPDGKRATEYGIALPAFIVSKDFKWPVLGLYCLLFTVGLPYVVVRWWSQSMRYTREHFLHDTMSLYYHALKPDPDTRDIIDILCASVEYREKIPARPDDAEGIQKLIKLIVAANPELEVRFTKTKYNADYCIKAKALVWAHLLRITCLSDSLALDQARVLVMSSALLQGMMKIASIRLWLGLAILIVHVSQYICQALDDQHAAPVFQLPHMTKALVEKSLMPGNIMAIQDVMELSEEKRREVFQDLTEDQVDDVMLVTSNIPWILADTELKVLAEEKIYVRSTITVKLCLQRFHYHGMVQKMKELNEQHKKENDPRRTVPDAKEKEPSKGDEEVEWDPSLTKRERVFREKGHSFPIHCPYFPEDREEAWWIFIGDSPDSPGGTLLTEPKRIDDLVTEKEVELYLPRVERPGRYCYYLFIISDNYYACDTRQPLVFTAVEAPKAVAHEPLESESDEDMALAAGDHFESDEESDLDSDN